jgi:hypothetical protein
VAGADLEPGPGRFEAVVVEVEVAAVAGSVEAIEAVAAGQQADGRSKVCGCRLGMPKGLSLGQRWRSQCSASKPPGGAAQLTELRVIRARQPPWGLLS